MQSKKSIVFLLHGSGFSFCTNAEDNPAKVSHYNYSGNEDFEKEIIREIDNTLLFKQNFEEKKVAVANNCFSLVPKTYSENEEEDVFLNLTQGFSDKISIIKNEIKGEKELVFGVNINMLDKLIDVFQGVRFFHSSAIFLNSIESGKAQEIHINLISNFLEIAVTNGDELLFYNNFEINSKEDFLFFTLYVAEKIGLDLNKIPLKYYGNLSPKTEYFQLLKKYIRNISSGEKNKAQKEDYTLLKLFSCE